MTDIQHDDRRQGGRRWRLVRWGGAALLLLAPAVAMPFTAEVNWGPADFALFAAMLVTACAAYEVALRITTARAWRTAIALAIAAAFLLTWAHLAVGLF
ncbi:MAG: hypothetical protein A2790_20325 [Phenylobacterium sp. RIFCSPHIGHO2_01_FULL_69_31]|uniref:hypothetical protein n=1 Tax=Phenylobacterium sp. RIFCSPHIGHO2_01_FULL_69_31 TaxID=1801944 RepID=UPI0008C70AD2|nr:hypothetical protein [Phenylobacterium sp. RIFCSPHIGHO2_01_FULL_69_31]OHB26307.1 MAG: hypothetical protein A2790_20325 [Phenylobacterium sp. RIFCSPHIGHO2_01_FULL_69_31]